MSPYVPKTSKYAPLVEYLAGLASEETKLSFAEIEAILGFNLPASARQYSAWWANSPASPTHTWASLWVDAGWRTGDIDLQNGFVTFRKLGDLERQQISDGDGYTPEASDLAEPPPRQQTTTYRILRDTALAKRVKTHHKNECQICGHTIVLPDGSRYSEGHHIQPLGKPHDGPDVMENIICVCPNHHAELDYGVRPLSLAQLRTVAGHSIGEEYIRYHNEVIRASRS
jgi:hypothetical protein